MATARLLHPGDRPWQLPADASQSLWISSDGSEAAEVLARILDWRLREGRGS